MSVNERDGAGYTTLTANLNEKLVFYYALLLILSIILVLISVL